MNDQELRCFTSGLTDQYFVKLRNAYRLFLESPQYKLVLHGSGFDEVCGLVLWKSSEESDRFFVEMEGSYDARAYVIHRSITVFEIEQDIGKHFLENRNGFLPLYLVKSNKSGLFYIALDEEGQDVFRKGDCGLPVIDIEMISKNVQKPVLSGQKFLEHWRKRCDNHLVLMYELSSFTTGAQESELKPAALKSIPGFVLDSWPSEASNWIDRTRSWPVPSVVEEAKRQNLFCVPLSSILPDSNSPPSNDEMFSLLWLVDFSEAEAVLMRNMTEFQKHVLLIFVKAYWKETPCHHRLPYRSLQLRHAFFWTLETSFEELWGKSDASVCVREICKTVSSFLNKGFFPHYFMPVFDLLTFDRCWESTCLSCCTNQVPTFGALFERFSSMSFVSESSFEVTTADRITCILREKLEILSGQSITLLFMLLYQRLHSASLDNAIDQHLELLLFLDREQTNCPDTRDLKNSLKAWITASLGVKYLIKLEQSPCDSLKTELESKARECLMRFSRHSVLHKAYSKLYLLSNRHSDSAVSKKGELSVSDSIKNVGEYEKEYENSEHDQTADETSRLSTVEFSQSLSQRMISACDEIDFMFAPMEKPLLSSIPGLFSTLEFTRCYVLGCSRCPVYSLSSRFLCNVFQILLFRNDGRINDALEVLTRLENEVLAQSKSTFMNDRKVAAYLFVVASIFFRLNRKEESLRSLKSSRNAFRSPRNPASWKILQTYTNKLRRCMTFGLEVLFVSGIVAVCAVYLSRILA